MSRAAYLRAWRQANPEKARAHNERQRRKRGVPPRVVLTDEERRLRKLARTREWRRANPEKVREGKRRRREREGACAAVGLWCCGMGPCSGRCEKGAS